MRLLYASGFSKTEKDSYRCIIFSNLLGSFQLVLEAMEVFGLTFEREENKV
jgi:guanine nucleotide-binding protein subunit alpha